MCVSGVGGFLCTYVCFRSILFLYCAFERRDKHFLQVFTESNLQGVFHNSGWKFFWWCHATLISALVEWEESGICVGLYTLHLLTSNNDFNLCLSAHWLVKRLCVEVDLSKKHFFPTAQEEQAEGLYGEICLSWHRNVCVRFSHGGSVEEYTRVSGGDCSEVPDYKEMYIGTSTGNHLATSNFMFAHRYDPENKGSFIKIKSQVMKPF